MWRLWWPCPAYRAAPLANRGAGWVFYGMRTALVTFGIGRALVSTVPAALVADVSQGRNERVIAVFSMVSDLGAVVGPLVCGWLADKYWFAAAFQAAAILLTGFAAALRIPSPAPD